MMNCVPDSVDNHDRQMILWLQMGCILHKNSQIFNKKNHILDINKAFLLHFEKTIHFLK